MPPSGWEGRPRTSPCFMPHDAPGKYTERLPAIGLNCDKLVHRLDRRCDPKHSSPTDRCRIQVKKGLRYPVRCRSEPDIPAKLYGSDVPLTEASRCSNRSQNSPSYPITSSGCPQFTAGQRWYIFSPSIFAKQASHAFDHSRVAGRHFREVVGAAFDGDGCRARGDDHRYELRVQCLPRSDGHSRGFSRDGGDIRRACAARADCGGDYLRREAEADPVARIATWLLVVSRPGATSESEGAEGSRPREALLRKW